MRLSNLKRFLSGGLATILTLSMFSFPVNAEEVDNDLDYYMSLDSNSEEYQEWKATISTTEDSNVSVFSLNESSTGIYNEYLEIICVGGNYSLGTTGGTPESSTDDNKKLLFGYPGSETSYTTIQIDGQNYKFVPSYITYDENIIVASNIYDGVKVSLCFSLIYNQYTGREDVAEFHYTLENTEESEHNVGVRIMFDTMLGSNDSSPFRIPNIGDTSSETDLMGNNIPEFWQSFDSLSSPSVIAQGTLKTDDSSTPDRVRFTNWSMANNNPWDYSRAEGTYNGDSAVCLYWNPKSISKGDSISCKTYYGLSSLQQDGTPPLTIALTGATRLEVSHNDFETDSYNPNPFTVTAYIQNVGDGSANNVKAKLNIPDSMAIVDGEQTVDLGNLAVNSKQYQVTWKIWVEPSAVDTVESYSVTVSADNADAKTIQRNIEIPALQDSGPLKLYLNRSLLDQSSTMMRLDFKLENGSNNLVDISNYIARYYFIDEAPNINKIFDIYYCGNQSVNNIPVNITYHSIPAPYKKQANAYLEFDFSNVSLFLANNEHLRINFGMHTDTWHTMLPSNDFSAVDSNYNGEEDLILWTKMPVYEKNTGKRIWGTEPKDGAENVDPQATIKCVSNTLINDSAVDMLIGIKNNSSVPIDLSKSELLYYYTNDNDYNQTINVHYVGGKINGNWSDITDKVSAEVNLLETKKDKADSVIKLTFADSVGTLCCDENIDIRLTICNKDWKQGKIDLSNDYSYCNITAPNYIANNIIFKAKYLDNVGRYAEYEYGNPIGDYKPTFSAFKIGEGRKEANTLQDYDNFIKYFSEDFGGVPYNEYALGENISNNDPNSTKDDFYFTNENLRSLLGSDIAYISGHGSRGGVIPIYPNGIRSDYSSGDEDTDNNIYEMLYNQIITTDKNVGIDFQNFGLFDSANKLDINNGEFVSNFYKGRDSINDNNIFSVNMKDHTDDGITENLQWIITGACSQVNKEKRGDPLNDNENKPLSNSSTDRWVDVLVNNKKLKGILGYHGQGPSANANNPDYEVIDDFLAYSCDFDGTMEPMNIHDAWIKANEFYHHVIVHDTLPCGLIVKEHYDDDCLYDSLISTDEVSCDYIYRYTARYVVIASIDDHNVGFVSYDDQLIIPDAINAIHNYYGSAIDENSISDEIMVIDREDYSNKGEFISSAVDEYIFNVSVNNNPASKKMLKSNSSSTIKLVRYDPETKSVEELS